jgi:hypothetical protein
VNGMTQHSRATRKDEAGESEQAQGTRSPGLGLVLGTPERPAGLLGRASEVSWVKFRDV